MRKPIFDRPPNQNQIVEYGPQCSTLREGFKKEVWDLPVQLSYRARQTQIIEEIKAQASCFRNLIVNIMIRAVRGIYVVLDF